jgi:site-specific DNA-methyltransferase (adenine-specific)
MQGDFIELEFDMKFDVIVGNPPYQDSKAHGKKTTGNGALWVRFTVKAIDLVKDNGFLGFVIPDSWTAPTYDLMGSRESIFNDYFKKNNLLYLNFDVKKFFPSVGIDPTAFLLKKDQNYTGTTIKTPIETINLDLSNMSFITKDLSTTSLSIHSKVLSNKENSRLFKMRWKKTVTSIEVQELKDQNFKYPFVDHHSYKPTRWAKTLDPDASKRKVLVPYVGKYQCIVDDAGVLGARESVSVLFLQDIEKGDFAERFFTSKLINFVMKTNQWTQYQLSQILNYIPVEDFSQDWNDNKIYKHFVLTQEEIDYVEANVK